MKSILVLPFAFFKFWYFEAPKGLLSYFVSFNKAFLQLFSLVLLVKTFFKPWKNEYREGLVGFSRAMGMFIKTFFIIADLVLLFVILVFEAFLFLAFLLWPVLTVYILFVNKI